VVRPPRRAAHLEVPAFVLLVQLLGQQPQVVQVDVKERLEPRALHLDDHDLAAVQHRAVHLGANGGVRCVASARRARTGVRVAR
jgi:hypothetical protein